MFKVLVVGLSQLEDTLNLIESEGFTIDKYEHAYDQFDCPMWMVSGYKE